MLKNRWQTGIVIAVFLLLVYFSFISKALEDYHNYLAEKESALDKEKSELVAMAELLLTSKEQLILGTNSSLIQIPTLDSNTNKTGSNTDKTGFTKVEVSQHSSKSDCWVILFDKVYDVTDLVKTHSGGDVFVCGTDQSSLFKGQHGTELKRMDPYYIDLLTTG